MVTCFNAAKADAGRMITGDDNKREDSVMDTTNNGDNERRTIKDEENYLRRYAMNCECVARLERRLAAAEERLMNVSAPPADREPMDGGAMPGAGSAITAKIELEERISALRDRGAVLRRETIAEIDRVNDARAVEVLECMYIFCMGIVETSDAVGYTPRHVQRIHADAVRSLAGVDQCVM